VTGQQGDAHECRVSVIIPAYNAARWLGETLESVHAQGVEGVETIVVDDGSRDATASLVRSQYPWVQLVCTPNRGVSAARTTGTEQARGRYIKYLDADDLLAGGALAAQLAQAEQVDVDVVYGGWQRLVPDAQGWRKGECVFRRWEEYGEAPELAFFSGMWCPTAAYLWRAAFLREKHPGWHPGLPVIQDARFVLDAARAGARFTYEPRVSVLYRMHDSGSVSTRSERAFWLDCERNTREIEEAWTHASRLDARQHRVLLSNWAQLARVGYAVDPSLARRAFAALKRLAPGYVPSEHPGYRALVRLVGPLGTEALLHAGRRVRRRIVGASHRSG